MTKALRLLINSERHASFISMQNHNMDLTKKVVIRTLELDWQPSPMPGVLRKPLERQQQESGHTTSLVKYAPESSFKSHIHPLGEEIYVLEGIFSDESGDYPKGSYLRNPPNSSHSPFSKEGCTLLVKLNQFDSRDLETLRIKPSPNDWRDGHGNLKVLPLHQFETEGTALVFWPKGEQFIPHRHMGGEEIFVISGVFQDEFAQYPKYTWIRSPHLSTHHPFVEEDTLIFVKTGHLK